MLRNSSEIIGYTIGASDGRLGKVTDFLFEDDTSLVRWLVIDTGPWLSGRKVLLPPSVLGQFSGIGDQFSVRLTMQQVKDSPASIPICRCPGSRRPTLTITMAGIPIGVGVLTSAVSPGERAACRRPLRGAVRAGGRRSRRG